MPIRYSLWSFPHVDRNISVMFGELIHICDETLCWFTRLLESAIEFHSCVNDVMSGNSAHFKPSWPLYNSFSIPRLGVTYLDYRLFSPTLYTRVSLPDRLSLCLLGPMLLWIALNELSSSKSKLPGGVSKNIWSTFLLFIYSLSPVHCSAVSFLSFFLHRPELYRPLFSPYKLYAFRIGYITC